MKRVLRVGGLICIALLLPMGIVLSCNQLETAETRYTGYADAAAKGAIAAGQWLPSWLPETALGIREVHNVDTNLVWVEFAQAGALGGSGGKCATVGNKNAKVNFPDLGSGFPRDIREHVQRLEKEPQLEVAYCDDTEARRRWTIVRIPGQGKSYAWAGPS